MLHVCVCAWDKSRVAVTPSMIYNIYPSLSVSGPYSNNSYIALCLTNIISRLPRPCPARQGCWQLQISREQIIGNFLEAFSSGLSQVISNIFHGNSAEISWNLLIMRMFCNLFLACSIWWQISKIHILWLCFRERILRWMYFAELPSMFNPDGFILNYSVQCTETRL